MLALETRKTMARCKEDHIDPTVMRYIPKKVQPYIMCAEKDIDGYWAYCVPGAKFIATDCHTAHGETVAEFKNDVRWIKEWENDPELDRMIERYERRNVNG